MLGIKNWPVVAFKEGQELVGTGNWSWWHMKEWDLAKIGSRLALMYERALGGEHWELGSSDYEGARIGGKWELASRGVSKEWSGISRNCQVSSSDLGMEVNCQDLGTDLQWKSTSNHLQSEVGIGNHQVVRYEGVYIENVLVMMFKRGGICRKYELTRSDV